MANLSKFDMEKIGRCTCLELIHPWTNTCSEAFFDMFVTSYLGTSKFFFIVYLAQLIMNRKSITMKYVMKFGVACLRTSLFGALYASCSMFTICALRHMINRFTYLTISVIPGIVGGLTIFTEDPAKRSVDATVYLSLVLELCLRKLQNTGMISRSSHLLETSLFMLTSATLLYLLRALHGSYSYMWFFVPPRVSSDPDKRQTCRHFGPCWKDITKTGLTYFLVGVGLQFLKVFVFRFKLLLKKPAIFLRFLFRKDNLFLGLFACLYVTVYKGVSCLLCKIRGEDAAWHTIPAGLAAGIAYRLQSNPAFLMSGVSNIIQIVIRHLKKKRKSFEKIPTDELVFALCSGVLYLMLVVDKDSCPSYAVNMVDTATGGRATRVYDTIEQEVYKRS